MGPLMDEYRRFGRPDKEISEPESMTKANPFFGGNERETSDGTGYPKGYSQKEDFHDYGRDSQGRQEIPSGRTILDDDIPLGDGLDNWELADNVDKPAIDRNQPVGPHNMQRDNIYNLIRRKTKKNKINKI